MEKSEVIRFDPARPYAQVHGQPGLSFQQDGHVFNGKGDMVNDFSKLQPVDDPEPAPEPEDNSLPKCYTTEDPGPQQQAVAEGLENTHWKTLQKMCSLYGINYENRDQAILALKGK